MARLGDIATYINGYAFKPTDWSDEGVQIIRIQDLTGNSYQANRYNGEYDSKYEVNKGDVLISWSASLGVYIWTGETAVLNQHIFKVKFDKTEIDKSFFVHQVENILENASNEAHGATMKHLTKPVFDALPFYLPPIDDQKRIAAELDKVGTLISLRKQQLAKLDELVKARFVEMFGDPQTNPLGWETDDMKGVCTKITDGEHGSVARVDSGNVFLNAKHVKKDGTIDWKTVTYTTDEVHSKIYARCNPEPGDILLTTTGTIGNVAIVPDVAPFSMDRGITLLKLRRDKVNSTFVAALLNFEGIQEVMNSNVHASAIGHLFLNKVMRIPVVVPPIELQNQFAIFVEQTDKSKSAIQQSLDKLETLKKALMQKYFG